MGTSMVNHILSSGYVVTVFNRTEGKAMPLRDKGAKIVNSAKEVAENSQIIFCMVGYPKDGTYLLLVIYIYICIYLHLEYDFC